MCFLLFFFGPTKLEVSLYVGRSASLLVPPSALLGNTRHSVGHASFEPSLASEITLRLSVSSDETSKN